MTKVAAVLLLVMSIASWVVIFWKAWMMPRASSTCRAAPCWQAPTLAAACEQLQGTDRDLLVQPMVDAALVAVQQSAHTLAGQGSRARNSSPDCFATPCTVRWRGCEFGEVLLAAVGSHGARL